MGLHAALVCVLIAFLPLRVLVLTLDRHSFPSAPGKRPKREVRGDLEGRASQHAAEEPGDDVARPEPADLTASSVRPAAQSARQLIRNKCCMILIRNAHTRTSLRK